MIHGLQLKVTSKELSSHCRARAEHHRKRATEKEAELPRLREAIEKVKSTTHIPVSVSNMTKGGNYAFDSENPVRDLERDIMNHKNKALVFDFYAEHFFDEDYNLTEADLQRLEILKDR